VCEDQRRSHQRNQNIIQEFSRIDSHLSAVSAKTERLRLLKVTILYQQNICGGFNFGITCISKGTWINITNNLFHIICHRYDSSCYKVTKIRLSYR
jgi:hypothetical protein